MKKPEEIKKGLEYCAAVDAPCEDCPFRCNHGAKCIRDKSETALAYIQQLEAQVPRWISVEERKPKRGEYVLFLYAKGAQNPVMHAKNPMVVGRYDYGMYLANGCEVEVTHWMPLPEPPKEG